MVDDVHDADEASLRLLHYLSRCVGRREGRPGAGPPRARARPTSRRSLRAWCPAAPGSSIELEPLDAGASQRLLIGQVPRPGSGCGRGDRADGRRAAVPHDRDGASPGERLRLGVGHAAARRRCGPSSGSPCSVRRSAPTSSSPSADGSEDETYDQLELALAALVVEPGRSRLPLPASARPRRARAASCRRTSARAATSAWPRRSPRLDRPPGQVAHHYLAAGLAVPGRAVRRPGRGDRRGAGRLPRRADPRRRRTRARRPRPPARPAGDAVGTC